MGNQHAERVQAHQLEVHLRRGQGRAAEPDVEAVHQVVLGEKFLSQYESHLRQMVRLTDGQYLCQCIVMPTLPVYRERSRVQPMYSQQFRMNE